MVKLPPKKIFDESKYYLQQLPSFSGKVKELVKKAGGPKRVIIFFLAFILVVSGTIYTVCFKKVPLKVSAYARPGSILIGDTLKFTFKVVMDKDTELEFPDIEQELQDFEVRNHESFEDVFFRKRTINRVYSITKYTPGEYNIAPMTLRYRDKGGIYWKTADTKEVTIRVKRLVKMDDMQPGRRIRTGEGLAGGGYKGTGMPSAGGEPGMGGGASVAAPIRYYIHDTEGPRRVFTVQDIVLRAVLYAIGGIVVLFIAVIVINTIRYKPEPGPEPVHVTAVKALDRLRSEKVLDKEGAKEFCLRLSRVLMGYVRIRYRMRPVEMTSKEFINDLETVEELTPDQKSFIKDSITLCDHVKYSVYEADKQQLDSLLKDVVKFVKETKLKEELEEENK